MIFPNNVEDFEITKSTLLKYHGHFMIMKSNNYWRYNHISKMGDFVDQLVGTTGQFMIMNKQKYVYRNPLLIAIQRNKANSITLPN